VFESRQNKGNKDLWKVYLCIDGDLQYSGNISAISWYGKNRGQKSQTNRKKDM